MFFKLEYQLMFLFRILFHTTSNNKQQTTNNKQQTTNNNNNNNKQHKKKKKKKIMEEKPIEDQEQQQKKPNPPEEKKKKRVRIVSRRKRDANQPTTKKTIQGDKKVFTGRPGGDKGKVEGEEERRKREQVEEGIKNSGLPTNYNFEIVKTVMRIIQQKKKRIALQMPEGLLLFACTITDLLLEFCEEVEEVVVMGDVTYGACCIDDFTAVALGCDLLVHYGHSCLVPIDITTISVLYVFVDIKMDVQHFIDTVKHNISSDSKVAFVSIIQFAASLQNAKLPLSKYFGSENVVIPQSLPLSPGEVLGCTSPRLPEDCKTVVSLGDGRFHLESVMIHNSKTVEKFYKYDPYSKVFSVEEYDYGRMVSVRWQAIEKAKKATKVGVVLGTLGRQGNPNILTHITTALTKANKDFIIVLLSEILPTKLKKFQEIEAWVQIACPRLSVDWGAYFGGTPVLNSYEASVCFGGAEWCGEGGEVGEGPKTYPMDYYSKEGGEWSNGERFRRKRK